MPKVLLWQNPSSTFNTINNYQTIQLADDATNYEELHFVRINQPTIIINVEAFMFNGLNNNNWVVNIMGSISNASWNSGAFNMPLIYNTTTFTFTPQFGTYIAEATINSANTAAGVTWSRYVAGGSAGTTTSDLVQIFRIYGVN